MDILYYAPVIIPTLNRYDHFRQCLESLERCKGADKTEVYIGLDYPPLDSEGNMIAKYSKGWEKINAYLYEKEAKNGFLKLIVIRRDHNCGVGTLDSNSSRLKKFIFDRFDRCIISEDDNVFSPNFLEFINKGLEKYKDDSTILSINGYSHPYHFRFDGNNYFHHNVDFSAWGYGIWKNRFEKYSKEIREEEIFHKTFSLKNIGRVKKIGYNRLLTYICSCLQPTMKYSRISDSVLTTYMAIKGMTLIMPSVSKVRNIGWDKSGLSFEKIEMTEDLIKKGEKHLFQIIDNENSFEFEGNPYVYFEYNNSIAITESDGRISKCDFFKKIIYLIPRLMVKRLLWPLLNKKNANG